jgi:hypothetical protein
MFENGVETGSQDLQAEGFPYGFLAVPQYETERILESAFIVAAASHGAD